MTNERAIELLNRISDSQFDGEHGDERREALSMAVRALEQNLVQESGDLVQDLVKDCISRQAAIDALKSQLSDWNDNYNIPVRKSIENIERLPSAQPERKSARWEILYPNHTYKYHCSECGANHKAMYDYCPSCGARMDGESDEML